MYEQIDFFETLGISIPKEEEKKQQIQYVNACGGCKCRTCANNVDCYEAKGIEQDFPCFNCDECYYYGGKGKSNKRTDCDEYKITNLHSSRLRKHFKII